MVKFFIECTDGGTLKASTRVPIEKAPELLKRIAHLDFGSTSELRVWLSNDDVLKLIKEFGIELTDIQKRQVDYYGLKKQQKFTQGR